MGGSSSVAHNMMAINKAGDEYALYNTSNNQWSAANTLPNLEKNGNQIPFSNVGSVCYIKIGQQDYTLFFNLQGTQYCLWENVNGFSPDYDL